MIYYYCFYVLISAGFVAGLFTVIECISLCSRGELGGGGGVFLKAETFISNNSVSVIFFQGYLTRNRKWIVSVPSKVL